MTGPQGWVQMPDGTTLAEFMKENAARESGRGESRFTPVDTSTRPPKVEPPYAGNSPLPNPNNTPWLPNTGRRSRFSWKPR
jgi:hypothetical protein